jgi:hypothetical protein
MPPVCPNHGIDAAFYLFALIFGEVLAGQIFVGGIQLFSATTAGMFTSGNKESIRSAGQG